MLEVKSNDFLVATSREQRVAHVNVTPSTTDVLIRGTVLANNDGTYEVLSSTTTESGTTTNVDKAEVILAEDVQPGTSTVVASVYVSGDFVENSLTVGATLTDAGRTNLKKCGIYLVNGIKE